MNTPAHSDPELRCAEYALGVLDADARRALEREAAADPSLAATLARWQARFAPLAEDVPPIAPPARVWTRIQRDLGFLPARGKAAGGERGAAGWWNHLGFWRWLGIGASLATVALVAVTLTTARHDVPAPGASTAARPGAGYMVATIARADGVAHWTATVDLRRARMVLVPADKPAIAANRSTELWLIPPNAKPIALGVFAADTPAAMALPPAVVAQLSARAVLAVSVEPVGGSPTGEPTGPVIASGAMHEA
ncbi:anti-sigma factor [Burkholderia glumae]|uniref:Anti-sigma factor n=1 Tax=Burkholderia glumae TaxID=337 RepID=A0AAQ0BPN4_BURGL|nr:anti-sigma factor [Burkholderia glumae]ACR32213.1 Anti-sigma-K factor RskA [Burkholderia glumae BGR1]AJY64228.1 anti-sigma-K factor rskA family protein [Burkholderia glumae LMG 2196 = ATCC 33617]KHJ62513.1 anti-sigma-K factor RskA [Burkholderia glumae]MCM2484601.1 anti-sigma factor [Burkholderia glumae]MCM2510294.1 anti-sigma factor [Burkholderia glumae]